MINIDGLFMKKEDFFDGAVESEKFKKVAAEIREEEQNKLLNKTKLDRDRTWSILSHQVVGAEIF